MDENSRELLHQLDCKTLRDVKFNTAAVESVLGKKLALKLVQFSKGCFDEDSRDLIQKLTSQRKSISVNYNFGIRFNEVVTYLLWPLIQL